MESVDLFSHKFEMRSYKPVAQTDIEHILSHVEADCLDLLGERLLITGGTGFFGTWLLEALVAANRQLNTNIQIWVLSRDPDAFSKRSPHLANAMNIHWIRGDVSDFSFPAGTFSHVIHAATTASAQLNDTRPTEMVTTILRGTERILEFAASHGTCRLLLTSSGAVYGEQPPSLATIPESYTGGPDCCSPASAYAEGKRMAELSCAIAAQSFGVESKIARCFAFVGPHLPLDLHFAAGNFLRDVLKGRNIQITGNGQPLRSYLYAADLVIWLLKILTRGKSLRPYNVGSDHPVSIAQLATLIAEMVPGCEVIIKENSNSQVPAPKYVPNISRARDELKLDIWTPLPNALHRTFSWLTNTYSSKQPI